MSKERFWEKFGPQMDSNSYRQTKYFGRPFARLRGKSLSTTISIKNSTGNILRDEKEILLRWREYLEDLLNLVRAKTKDTCATIGFGKEEVFALTKVAATIQGLKFGKAAGEDEIRREMFKALNGKRVRWLTRVCQMAWKLGKTPID